MKQIYSLLSKNILNGSSFLFFLFAIFTFAFYATADESTHGKNFFLDTDQDGLSNEEELAYGTDQDNPDTDSDGYSDGVEIESGYDPLKAAPGDRIVSDAAVLGESDETIDIDDKDNLTVKTSAAIAELVQEVSTSTDENVGVDSEDVSKVLQDALSSSQQEIVLPEVDIKSIKVKKIPKNLKGEKRAAREKQDIIQYVTLIGYLMMNNSPITMTSQDDAGKVVQKIASDSSAALASGNFAYLDTLEKQGRKLYDQLKDIEVPEAMFERHVKALQLALYAAELKNELKASQVDPLGQVYSYGKVQAFMNEIQSFVDEIVAVIADYGIENISIGL